MTNTHGDFAPCHAEPPECGCIETDAYAQALILQGVDYAAAEDKAFMAKEAAQMNVAHGGLDATIKALALHLDGDLARANELILSATD